VHLTEVLPIPSCPDYYVDLAGRVWSVKPGQGGRYKGLHVMSVWVDRDGYHHVTMIVDGRRIRRTVHSLVAEAFYGDRPKSQVIRHLDDNPGNNAPDNLAYGTQKENVEDRDSKGRHSHGDRSHLSKITDEKAADAMRRLSEGETRRSVAASLGVAVSTLDAIRSGRTRKHLRLVA
jgi:hypothetical protein